MQKTKTDSKTTTEPHEQRLIDLSEVTNMCGIGKSLVYQLMRQNQFPKQRQISSNTVRWVHSEVDEWIQEHIDKGR